MRQFEVNPEISNFVVFSGGGGLVTREAQLELEPGDNQVTIREVPASFDPDTMVIEISNPSVTLREFVARKPNRQYVDDNLRREGACAQKLINDSVEVGSKRPEILDICEKVLLRTYLDEEVYLVIWLNSPEKLKAKLSLSYFINDTRFSWKPTIMVEIEEGGEEANVKGFIAITNESANRFDNVEVSFADFARELGESAENVRLEPDEFKKEMQKQRMKIMKIM